MKDIFGSSGTGVAPPQAATPPDGIVQVGLRVFNVRRANGETMDVVAHKYVIGPNGTLAFSTVELFGGMGMESLTYAMAPGTWLEVTLTERLSDPANGKIVVD